MQELTQIEITSVSGGLSPEHLVMAGTVVSAGLGYVTSYALGVEEVDMQVISAFYGVFLYVLGLNALVH